MKQKIKLSTVIGKFAHGKQPRIQVEIQDFQARKTFLTASKFWRPEAREAGRIALVATTENDPMKIEAQMDTPILKKRGIVKFEIRPTKHQATYDALDGYEFGMGLAEAWWWPQARTLWLYPVPVEYRKAVNRKTNGA